MGSFVPAYFMCQNELVKLINDEVPPMNHAPVPLSRVIDFKDRFQDIIERWRMEDTWSIKVIQEDDRNETSVVTFEYRSP